MEAETRYRAQAETTAPTVALKWRAEAVVSAIYGGSQSDQARLHAVLAAPSAGLWALNEETPQPNFAATLELHGPVTAGHAELTGSERIQRWIGSNFRTGTLRVSA